MSMMRRHTEQFPVQLAGFDFDTLEKNASCICALPPRVTLNYLNPAWFKFAQDNGNAAAIGQHYGIGSMTMDAFSEPFKSYYAGIYMGLLASGNTWQHEYECSSNSLFRLFHQTIFLLRNRSGLLLVNSLRIDHTHLTGAEQAALARDYLEPSGLMTACVHCQRVHRKQDSGIWDSIPRWTGTMPANTSHSLCAICYDYYYKHLYAAHA